jgi:hypothetical protein
MPLQRLNASEPPADTTGTGAVAYKGPAAASPTPEHSCAPTTPTPSWREQSQRLTDHLRRVLDPPEIASGSGRPPTPHNPFAAPAASPSAPAFNAELGDRQ